MAAVRRAMRLSIRRGAATRRISGPAGSLSIVERRWREIDRSDGHRLRSRRPAACVFADWRTPLPRAPRTSCAATSKRRSSRFAICWGCRWRSRCRPLSLRLGHHARHERADHAQRCADGAGDDARLRRRAGDRLPGPAAAVRSDGSQAAAADDGGRRDRRARDARRAGACCAATKQSCGSNCKSLRDAGIESLAICLLHADRHPRARATGRAHCARSWLSRDQRVARRRAAAEVRGAGRYDGRRCVFESGAARVRRAAARRRCQAASCGC